LAEKYLLISYFFGLGTSDDKFGVTMLMATLLRLKAAGFVPIRNLVIAFTGDMDRFPQRSERIPGTIR
jgi:hypothetical protein